MANKPILTYGSKVYSVEQNYFAPSVVLPPEYKTLSSLYCFLAGVEPWSDDNNPPEPTQDQKYLKKVLKNVFVVKHILSNDISPVIERINWTSGITYDYYRDDIDMFQKTTEGKLQYQFYIKNKYDQVFKCLWNNNNQSSIDEPYFQPGSYNTNNIFQGSDGYKWKYIYTIPTGLKIKFMDSDWMPLSADVSTVNPLLTSAGYGNIDVINVTDGGTGYDTSNAIITVSITGDGSGAAGSAVTENGTITDIVVTNTGTNYTYANVSVSSSLGSNAVVIAPVSPIGGHGHDAITELGCHRVMITSQFEGSESNLIPTDITYHQLGIISNPVTLSLPDTIANGSIYKTTTDLVVAPGFGDFISGELLYQGTSVNDFSFLGTILSFDVGSNVVRLINTQGTLTINSPVFGNSTSTTRTLLSYSTPDFVTLSGYIYYLENRSGIERSSDGIEQFKIVLEF